MQFEYLDLFLIHSPADTINRLDQWRALLYARDELGLVRSIGVSNYQTRHLEEIRRAGLELPAVNQLQIHLWLTRDEDLVYAQSNGIVLEAWAPLGHVPWWEQEPSLLRVATAHGVTPAAVLLQWHVQRSVVPIFGTDSVEHLASDLKVLSFLLSDEEMAALNACNRNESAPTYISMEQMFGSIQ